VAPTSLTAVATRSQFCPELVRLILSAGTKNKAGARYELAAEGEQEVMSLNPLRTCTSIFAVAVLAVASILAIPTVGHSQEVAVLVNGEPITVLDIEQRTKFVQMSTNKVPARQEVLDGLIDEILEIQEAKHFSIEVPASETDNAFANVATRMGVDSPKLIQILVKGGASAETLKHRLKAELAWNELVRGRYKASLEVADSDVEAELELHKPQDKNELGYEYILRPIVMVVPRGSPDAAFEARKHEADALRTRFENCAAGIPFARALREVAVRDPVTKYSADLVPELRDLLDKTDIGHLTPPEQTAEGVQMFALCGKKETKSDTPGKKEMRDQLFQRKFGAQAKHYLAELRREAMIEYK
jgi:peptidyl-prolyl cis-trans isomerase SurA